MKKIISIALTCMLVVAMCCTGVPVSAVDSDKAVIHTYDFYGDTINNATAQTHEELSGKGVKGETYTFDVGDIVNISISYTSDVEKAISTASGLLYVNQTSVDPTNKEAFRKDTNDSVNTLNFSDEYFTSKDREKPANNGIYYSSTDVFGMCNPDRAFNKNDAEWAENVDSSIDRCTYVASYLYDKGYSIETPSNIFTMTVVVTEASESYLYTVLNSVTRADDDELVETEIGDDIIVSTTLEKVGHIDNEKPAETEPVTEPETDAETEPKTEPVTQPTTEAETEPETQPATESKTKPKKAKSKKTAQAGYAYTVVGGPALCGSNWDPTNLNNDTSEIAKGVFQKVYTGVKESDIEFKIVENHSWDNSFGPEGNAIASPNCIDKVLYDDAIVTVTFESSTGVVSWKIDYPTSEGTETEKDTEPVTEALTEAKTEPVTDNTKGNSKDNTKDNSTAHTYTVAGVAFMCGTSWDPTDVNNDMIEISPNVFQKVYTDVIKGAIEFNVVEDYSWENSYGPKGNAIGSSACVDYIEKDSATVTITFNKVKGIVTWIIEYPDEPTEPKTEPATELITEPKTELVTKPITEPKTKPATEPTTEKPTEEESKPANTYTVAGVSALCVSNWDPTDTSNDMIGISEGLFQKVYTDVKAGAIEFKITDNHSWDNSYGTQGNAPVSANCADTVAADGATVTISFDSINGVVTWAIEYPSMTTEPEKYTEAPTIALTAEAPTDESTKAPTTEKPTAESTKAPATEKPTDESTKLPTIEKPTAESTQATTNIPTDVATDATTATKATTATTAPTSATNATQQTTTSSTNTAQSSQTATGKVATGDASSVTMLLTLIMLVSSLIVSRRNPSAK